MRYDEVDDLQQDINYALGDLVAKLPTHTTGNIVWEQLRTWALKVKRAGPVASHATVSVESYMVFLKSLVRGTRNQMQSMMNAYVLAESVIMSGVTRHDLAIPDIYRKDFVVRWKGKPRRTSYMVNNDLNIVLASVVYNLLSIVYICLGLAGPR